MAPIKRGEDNIKLAEGIEIFNFGGGHAWGMLGLTDQYARNGRNYFSI